MINALQHIGLGVTNAAEVYSFYRRILGFNLKIADIENDFEQMAPLLGKSEKMRIIMALNSRGGGASEFVEHISTVPRQGPEKIKWGDIGFLSSGYQVNNLPAIVQRMEKKGVRFVIRSHSFEIRDGKSCQSAFCYDPEGNLVELVEIDFDKSAKPKVSGLAQVTIGVTDMEQSLAFYGDILGYDHVLLDHTGTNQELAPLFGEGISFRQVLLNRSQGSTSVFPMLDGGRLRLVQTLNHQGRRIYQDRRWGDIGQMECCFDVSDIHETVEYLQSKNVGIVLPPTFLNMGSGSSGFFAYIRDPDGNLIEIVEVKKIAWLPPRIVSPLLQLLSPCFSKIIR